MSRKAVVREHLPGLVAAVLAAGFVLWLSSRIPPEIRLPRFCDSYFGADVFRAFPDMTTPTTPYGSNTKHPLINLLQIPSGALQLGLSCSAWEAIRVIFVTNAFVWAAAVFTLCKHITGRKLDALLLTILALSTSAAMFWLPTPETFALGSTTILLPLTLLSCSRACRSYTLHVFAHVLALAITITNWASALVCSQIAFGTRKNLLIGLHALGVLCLLTALQPLIAERSGFVNARDAIGYWNAFGNRQGIPDTLKHVFLTPLSPRWIEYRIIPKGDPFPPRDVPNIDARKRPGATLDRVDPPSQVLQHLQYVLWFLLLGMSLYQFVRHHRANRVLVALYLATAAQLLIALMYGEQTFLFSMHWTPLLVISIGASLSSRFRVAAVTSVVVLAAANLVTNMSMFVDSTAILQAALRPAP